MTNQRLIKALRRAVTKVRDERIYGTLGRTNADGTVTVTASRQGYVLITMDNGTLIELSNTGSGHVPERAGLPVKMIRLHNGALVLDGTDDRLLEGDAFLPGAYGVLPHAASHQHGGSDEVSTTTPGANKIVQSDADGYIGAGWLDPADLASGAVDSVNGQTGVVVLDTDDVSEGATNKYTTATSVGGVIGGVSADDTVDDTDSFAYVTSSTLKKTAWSVIKSTLKTYFDTLYNLYVHPNHTGDVTSVGDGATTIANNAVTNAKAAQMGANTVKSNITGSTANAADNDIATMLAQYIHAATGKTTPTGNDELALIDSAASNVLKKLTVTNLNVYLATLYFVLAGQSGGQTAKGGTGSGENLTLMSTANAGKGKILLGTSGYDEANNRLGILTQSPTKPLQVGAAATDLHSSGTRIALNNDASGAELSVATGHATQRSGLSLIRSRGDLTTPTTVADGDNVGFLAWKAYDGTNVLAPGIIEGQVDGSVSTGTVPVRVILATGNSNSRTTRQTWFSDGKVAVGDLTAVGASLLGVKAGNSSNDAAVGGVLYVTVGAFGQVGGGPDTLASYSVPANTLAVNNQSIWWRAAGTISTSATSGVIVIKFGATTLLTINASPVSGGEWWAEGEIYRTGAATQRAVSHGYCQQGSTDARAHGNVTPAETLSGAVTLAVTGNSSSAANNDTVLHTLKIGWDDANS